MSDLAKYEKPLTPVFANKVKEYPFAIHFQLGEDIVPHESIEVYLDRNYSVFVPADPDHPEDDPRYEFKINVQGPEDQELVIPKNTWVTCVITYSGVYVVISPECNISFGVTTAGVAPNGLGPVQLKLYRSSYQQLELTTGNYSRGTVVPSSPEYVYGDMYFLIENQKSASFPYGSASSLMKQKLEAMSILHGVQFDFTKSDNNHYIFQVTNDVPWDKRVVLVPDANMDPALWTSPLPAVPTPPYRYGFQCTNEAVFSLTDTIKECQNPSKQNSIKPNSECIVEKIAGTWMITWYEEPGT